MPALAANSLSVTFGDFSRGYTIVQRKTITLLHDPNTNKPYVRFYTARRVGGGVLGFHATRFIKFA
jgi:HK97 family phage major capsid protein